MMKRIGDDVEVISRRTLNSMKDMVVCTGLLSYSENEIVIDMSSHIITPCRRLTVKRDEQTFPSARHV